MRSPFFASSRWRPTGLTLVAAILLCVVVSGRPAATDRGVAGRPRSTGVGALSPAGGALHRAFEREAADAVWTQATRDHLAPLLFSSGFDVRCHVSLCVLETTFANAGAFRDFSEAVFDGRHPLWAGTFMLANAEPPFGPRAAGRELPWRAIIILGDVRRAPPRPAGEAISSAVRVTPGTAGRPERPSDANSWSVRSADGVPEGTMQNVSSSQYRELVIPLIRLAAARGETRAATWHAFVAVGGPDLLGQPAQCALDQLDSSDPRASALIGGSGPSGYDATYDVNSGIIELVLPGGLETAETVVKCHVPPQGWIGNVVWHTSAEASADDVDSLGPAPAPGPYAANSEG